MKRTLLILLFLPITGFAQNKLDFGEIKGDTLCSLVDSRHRNICKSKNQFEIYLLNIGLPFGGMQEINISFDGYKWTALKYRMLEKKIDSFLLKPVSSFEKIFSELKNNDVFNLPDQSELKGVKYSVLDGNVYVLTFKAANKYRSYQFNNPGLFLEFNKDIPEFNNYVNIVNILFNWLKKE